MHIVWNSLTGSVESRELHNGRTQSFGCEALAEQESGNVCVLGPGLPGVIIKMIWAQINHTHRAVSVPAHVTMGYFMLH